MRVLVLCKRRPQGRDLFTEPYGRFYFLSRRLAERGHEVRLALLSYRQDPPAERVIDQMQVTSHPLPMLSGPLPYTLSTGRLCREFRPDWIIGFSDLWYGIIAQQLAAWHGTRCLIDAYDNYESYYRHLGPLRYLWRRSVAQSDCVVAAGPQLAALLERSMNGRKAAIIPMAADPLFRPLDRMECRKKLGLPTDIPLVGYTGSLHPSRGIKHLFAVYEELRRRRPDVQLVLSGRAFDQKQFPPGTHWLGYRPSEDVPAILNSLNVLFVINQPSSFGNYSYPAKLYEAMACRIPAVASSVSGTSWILRDLPQCLASAFDPSDFAAKAEHALAMDRIDYPALTDWSVCGDELERLLLAKSFDSGHPPSLREP